MSESDALRKLAVYLPKIASIWVLFWSWFNTKLKSKSKDRRYAILFQRGYHDNDETTLKPVFDRSLRKGGPNIFKGTEKSKQTNRTSIGWPLLKFTRKLLFEQDVFEVRPAGKFGNGVFATRNVTFEEVRNALIGKESGGGRENGGGGGGGGGGWGGLV